jgi:hypothetical protein
MMTVIGIVIGVLGGALGLIVTWDEAGLPVPATVEYVNTTQEAYEILSLDRFNELEQYAGETRELSLVLSLGNLQEQLDRIDQQLAKDPNNLGLKDIRRSIVEQITWTRRKLDDARSK